MPDPYGTLGVDPAADEATIRAAYRSLMKRYHPDQNRSADAADKAREVAAAYRLLSDPEQRARHDRQRAMREQVIAGPPPAPPRAPPRGRLGGLLLVILSLGIAGFAVMRLDRPTSPVQRPPVAVEQQAATAHPQVAPEVAAVDVPPVPVAPPPVEIAQVTAPVPDLPSPVREPAAPPTAAEPPPPVAAARLPDAQPTPAQARRIAASLPKPAATVPGPATDDCEAALTCARIDLPALERMQALLYNQSYLAAAPPKQARLLSTRAAFLARLGRCASAACKRDAYLDRNREIAALMRS